MAPKKKNAAPVATTEDVAITQAAVVAYFNGEVNLRQAELETALKALSEAEARRAEIAGGARMTLGEYVMVHAAVQAPALELARAIIDGKSDKTKADVDLIRDQADAVKRGLVADGYTEVELS